MASLHQGIQTYQNVIRHENAQYAGTAFLQKELSPLSFLFLSHPNVIDPDPIIILQI